MEVFARLSLKRLGYLVLASSPSRLPTVAIGGANFATLVDAMPENVGARWMSDDVDYMLHAQTPSAHVFIVTSTQ